MSERHPIIAITGSSGAGTSTVTRTFANIFRRENLTAAIIEGDSFHRYDRKEMKLRQAEAEKSGNMNFSHFGPDNNLFGASTCITTKRPLPTSRALARLPHGKTCLLTPTCCSTKDCTAPWSPRSTTSPSIRTC